MEPMLIFLADERARALRRDAALVRRGRPAGRGRLARRRSGSAVA